MTPDLFRSLVSQAILAPSVHNVQPARWRLEGKTVWLLEDRRVRLAHADPTGHDAAMSLGAAFEGLSLAAADLGLQAHLSPIEPGAGDLAPIAQISFTGGAVPDPLSKTVPVRQSWRGAFAPASVHDRKTAVNLVAPDCEVLTDPETIGNIATLVDTASFGFITRPGFRAELVSWMRLWRRHPNWARDGLNADAMHLGPLEKMGAGLVMGTGFAPLNALGLAAPLLAETDKTKGAAGIALFHRPDGEDPFDSGRAFYRAWLRVDAAGFGAAVLAALADDPDAAADVAQMAALPGDRRLVSAMRVGRRPNHAAIPRARRSVDDVIV